MSRESQIIDFVLAKSTIPAGKKKRILYLLKARDDFSQLADTSWEDLNIRNLLCRMTAATHSLSQNELPGEIPPLENHEAAWALLQAVAMDNKYLEQTEYNAFKLIRLGNQFSHKDPVCSAGIANCPRSIKSDQLAGSMGDISQGQMPSTADR